MDNDVNKFDILGYCFIFRCLIYNDLYSMV